MASEPDSWFQKAFNVGKDVFEGVEAKAAEAEAAAAQKLKEAQAFAAQKAKDAQDFAVKKVAEAKAFVTQKAKDAAGMAGLGGPKPATPPAQRVGAGGGGGGSLTGPVGRGGKNKPDDVKFVQRALGLNEDGKCGPQTIGAIENFQKSLGQAKPDGRIDPGGPTLRALMSGGLGAKLPDPAEIGKAAENKAAELKKDAGDVADGVAKEAKKDAEIAAEKLKEAGRLVEDLAIKVKDFGVAIARDTEGCRLQAAAIALAVVTASAGIAAVVFPAPADVTPGVVVAAPIQVAGIVTMLTGVAGLIAAGAAYINCKLDQLETLNKEAKEAARDRKNAELEEKIRKQQQQIDDINKRKQDLQNSVNQIRKFVK